jgi:signal transduction histidine kinase
MGLRRRSIRLRIFLLVVIPILSLIGMYAFAATITASDAISLSRSKSVFNTISLPSGLMESALDSERVYAVVYLADPAPLDRAALQAQEQKTDRSVAGFKAAAGAAAGSESTPEKQAFATMFADLARLPALRSQIASQAISRPQVISAYDSMVSQNGVLEDQIILQGADARIIGVSLALNRTGNVVNLLLQEEAVLLGDTLARSYSAAGRQEVAELVGARQAMYAEMLSEFDPTVRAIYTRDLSPRVLRPLEAIENTVISQPRTGRVPPVSPIALSAAVQAVSDRYAAASEQSAAVVTAQAQPVANSTFLRLILVASLGLLAIIVSIIISAWIGRGLVQELAALRRSALDLASRRLPSVVERLRAGHDVDVTAEAPPLESSGDEIGQVTEAFNAVQRTAVEAAVDEAKLRRGVSDVFRNLARRSQSLLHRQLAMLDEMERRASEPEELENLFRIDHLTTRMRRHAEGLIILSGESPGRGWRHPVAFVDVLRAAAAEVEDYTRIRVTTRTRAALIGPAVADVIHMIAELAENATIYSPPNTPVRIHGDLVGRGFAVEIEDRGLGLTEEKLAKINHNFAQPPPFDLSGSEQLGLFVAGQLARRHDIQITLQASPYGGITAIVLIPKALVVDEGAYDPQVTAAITHERAIRLTGRPASLKRGVIAEPAALAQPSALPSAAGPLPAQVSSLPPGPETEPPTGNGTEPPAIPAAQPDGVFMPRRPLEAASTPSGPSWFGSGQPAAQPASSDDTGPQIAGTQRSVMGLPIRVRQASLAPQLRDAGPLAADTADEVPSAPAPEAARNTMTALQRGWERGRSVSAKQEPLSETMLSAEPSGNGGEQRSDE